MGTYGAGQAEAKTASLPAAAASIAPKARPFRWRIVGAFDFLRRDPCHVRTGWLPVWVREALGWWIVAGALSGVGRIEAQTIQLGLSPPDYGDCGAVSVNGGVSTANGQIVRIQWDWGDGTHGDSWFPASHSYQQNGSYSVTVTAFASDGNTQSQTATCFIFNAGAPGCAYILRVCPGVVCLAKGKTNETLRVDLRDGNGSLVPVASDQVQFSSSNPGLVGVDAAGLVSSTGLGQSRIRVSIASLRRAVTVPVYAGEVWTEPPILLLSTRDQPAGRLTVQAWNADGSTVDLGRHAVTFSGANSVATVDASGTVTALRPPAVFSETPYITAAVDGQPVRNATVVRVTGSSLGLVMQDFGGQFVSYCVAERVGSFQYGNLTRQLQVVEVTDAVFQLERWLSGCIPSAGGRQFLVLDPGFDLDGTVPCGLSGNPVRLGTGVDNLRSCFGGADWIQWGVIAHELGHDFLPHAALSQIAGGLPQAAAFFEGMASTLGASALDDIQQHLGEYGMSATTVASFQGQYLPLAPTNDRFVHYQSLTKYEAKPDFANGFNADVFDAIMFKLRDEFGRDFVFRLMSVLYPPEEPLPFAFADDAQRVTCWVAACSAAAQTDLRARFQTRWGFPLDASFYDRIYGTVNQRASQRGSQGTILVRVSPAGAGSVIGDGSYDYGAAASVRAVANPGYVFVNWTDAGQAVGTAADFSFTVSSNRTLIANFGGVPIIVTPPQSQTVFAGADATFTVTAGGSDPLGYQWMIGDKNIAGATLSALTLHAVQPGDADNYAVRVTNAFGATVSSGALLTVVVLESPVLEAPQLKGDGLHLPIRAQAGATYLLQATDRFADWETVSSLRAEGPLAEFIAELPSHAFQFFRVMALPPSPTNP
jgi:hypothetical protein